MGKCVGVWGGDVGKCIEVWGPNTLLIPHISSLPSPFPAFPLTSPTPHHTFLHLLSYLFPHLPFLPPHPNTFSYYPYITLHFLEVWRSYHVTKFLWRSYHVAKLLATLLYCISVNKFLLLQLRILFFPPHALCSDCNNIIYTFSHSIYVLQS